MKANKQTVLGCIAVATFLAGGLVSHASASVPEWRECIKTTKGIYEGSKCTIGNEKGGSEWKSTAETKEVDLTKGLAELVVLPKGPTVKCGETGKGWIGVKGHGGLSSIQLTSCELIKAGSCETGKSVSLKPIDLPWGTAMEEEGTRGIIDSIEAGGGPGLKIECFISGKSTVENECFGLTAGMTNNETKGTVEAEFEGSAHQSQCRIGTEKTGEVNGTVALVDNSAAIETLGAAPLWYVNGVELGGNEATLAQPVPAQKLKFISNTIEVACERAVAEKGEIGLGSIFLEKTTIDCTVPVPERAGVEKCKVAGESITLNKLTGLLRWKEQFGEEALFKLYDNAMGVVAEFDIEKEGALLCSVSGTYKVTGEFIAELKHSTTEETVKSFLAPCPTPLTQYWNLAAPGSRRQFPLVASLKITKEGAAAEDGKICGEWEFSLDGALLEKPFRIKAL